MSDIELEISDLVSEIERLRAELLKREAEIIAANAKMERQREVLKSHTEGFYSLREKLRVLTEGGTSPKLYDEKFVQALYRQNGNLRFRNKSLLAKLMAYECVKAPS